MFLIALLFKEKNQSIELISDILQNEISDGYIKVGIFECGWRIKDFFDFIIA